MKLVSVILPLAALTFAAPAPAAPGAVRPVQMRTFPGVSNSGNAIINEGGRPDPQIEALGRQSRALHDQINAAIGSPNVDIDRIAGLLRQGDALDAQVRARITERIVGTVRQLSAADRAAFLRDLLSPQQQGMPQR